MSPWRSGGAGRAVKSQVCNLPMMRARSLVLASQARPAGGLLRGLVDPWVEDPVLKAVQARAWTEAGR